MSGTPETKTNLDEQKYKTGKSIIPTTTNSLPLRLSLFSNVPPTINFILPNIAYSNELPNQVREHLTWKGATFAISIVKNAGFCFLSHSSDSDCTAIWTTWFTNVPTNKKFQDLKLGQKINQFPGTINIERKDNLWKSIHKMILKFGESEFGFQPETFCLPAETQLLKKAWSSKGSHERWIVKPHLLSQGIGIKVVSEWSQIPLNKPRIVQRYLHHPYLINQTKFDLRLYVLITSVDPLRIFLYDNGLVRFATNKYTNDIISLDDTKTHLTNSHINKQADMWTLKLLWNYFDQEEINQTIIWEKIKDLIVKTVISSENVLANLFKDNVNSRYTCYEMFGFDIMLDDQLKPWLLEINRFPYLSGRQTKDVKEPVITEVLNLARFHLPINLPLSTQREIVHSLGYGSISFCLDNRLYSKKISKIEKMKQDSWLAIAAASGTTATPLGILDKLTPDDTRHLVVSEDELAIAEHFQRIFPTDTTTKYLKFMEKPSYYNLLLAAWEIKCTGNNRERGRFVLEHLCEQRYHQMGPEIYDETAKVNPTYMKSVEKICAEIESSKKKLDELAYKHEIKSRQNQMDPEIYDKTIKENPTNLKSVEKIFAEIESSKKKLDELVSKYEIKSSQNQMDPEIYDKTAKVNPTCMKSVEKIFTEIEYIKKKHDELASKYGNKSSQNVKGVEPQKIKKSRGCCFIM